MAGAQLGNSDDRALQNWISFANDESNSELWAGTTWVRNPADKVKAEDIIEVVVNQGVDPSSTPTPLALTHSGHRACHIGVAVWSILLALFLSAGFIF